MYIYTYLKNSSEEKVLLNYAKEVFSDAIYIKSPSVEALINECKESRDSDLLLMDIIKDGVDNTYIIDKIRQSGCKIKIVVLSAVDSQVLFNKAIEYGADYIILKPYDINAIFHSIKLVTKGYLKFGIKKSPDRCMKRYMVDREIAQILADCGVTPNLKSFGYLKFAAREGFFDLGVIEGITKRLYPLIAICFNASVEQAERSIRHTIEGAWKSDVFDVGFKKLGFSKTVYTKRPKNSEFVYALVEYVRNNVGK